VKVKVPKRAKDAPSVACLDRMLCVDCFDRLVETNDDTDGSRWLDGPLWPSNEERAATLSRYRQRQEQHHG
jgi:hypothetical protein